MSIAENAVALKFFSKVRYLIRVFAARHAGMMLKLWQECTESILDMIHAMAEGDIDKPCRPSPTRSDKPAGTAERILSLGAEALLRSQIQDFFHDEHSEEVIGD